MRKFFAIAAAAVIAAVFAVNAQESTSSYTNGPGILGNSFAYNTNAPGQHFTRTYTPQFVGFILTGAGTTSCNGFYRTNAVASDFTNSANANALVVLNAGVWQVAVSSVVYYQATNSGTAVNVGQALGQWTTQQGGSSSPPPFCAASNILVLTGTNYP